MEDKAVKRSVKKSAKQGKGIACPVFSKCGGCQLQNMDYAGQLSFKQAKCIKLLGKFGHVDEIIGMKEPTHYRCKVQAAFGTTRGGKIISGVYQASSHRIVLVNDCMLENRKADKIIVTIRALLSEFHLSPYNEDTGRGFLRHVLVRVGYYTGEIMVVLVTSTPMFPRKNDFLRQLLTLHPEITTVVQNINAAETSMVLGTSEKVLFGKGAIEDRLCGCTFRISPTAFYQINPVQTQVLYNTAMNFAGLTGEETVLDAYCGVGTIGLVAAKNAKQVIGVELNADAVHDAVANAKLNRADNIRFLCADAGDYARELAENGETVDVLFMDPPRAGSSPRFLASAVKLAPKRIVYISCNPETLAKDLLTLTRGGYRVKKIQPVDMFPWTEHVETVVLLSKLISSQHIEIDLALDELDTTAAEKTATYSQIQAYVEEHFGLKVSPLYIAQVKRKFGIIERDSYNKPKNADAKQPKCPPEKEKAITETLRFFGMIK